MGMDMGVFSKELLDSIWNARSVESMGDFAFDPACESFSSKGSCGGSNDYLISSVGNDCPQQLHVLGYFGILELS